MQSLWDILGAQLPWGLGKLEPKSELGRKALCLVSSSSKPRAPVVGDVRERENDSKD